MIGHARSESESHAGRKKKVDSQQRGIPMPPMNPNWLKPFTSVASRAKKAAEVVSDDVIVGRHVFVMEMRSDSFTLFPLSRRSSRYRDMRIRL